MCVTSDNFLQFHDKLPEACRSVSASVYSTINYLERADLCEHGLAAAGVPAGLEADPRGRNAALRVERRQQLVSELFRLG